MPIFLWSMIKVQPFIYESFDELYANTYLLIDENKACVVIDPGKDYPGLVDYIKKNGLTLKAVLLTHGHVDHMRGADKLVDAFNVPLYIGFDDEDKLLDEYANCSLFLEEHVTVKSKAQTLADNEVLHFSSEDILVIAVPYHTSGSVCYYLKDSELLFTGDFILPHGVGRSDLPSAKPRELRNSMAKIVALPHQTKIYPGHGPFSSIEEELKVNPFVK